MTFEKKALVSGVIINAFSAVVGIIFFIWTKAQSLFLDAFISLLLFVSSIISILVSAFLKKEGNNKYPLGKIGYENIFLIFRSILMLLIILGTIFNAVDVITIYYTKGTIESVDISVINMVLYSVLMVGSCIAITIFYSYYNHKIEGGSEIVKIEIKSSIFDGLVTLFCTSSLLIFTYVPALNFLEPIGDSITAIVISLIYLFVPIKEIIIQCKTLAGRRLNKDDEKEIKNKLVERYSNYNYTDIYYSFSSKESSIYIVLSPKENINSEEMMQDFKEIKEFLYQEYNNAKVYLIFDNEKLYTL